MSWSSFWKYILIDQIHEKAKYWSNSFIFSDENENCYLLFLNVGIHNALQQTGDMHRMDA